ncbi:tetratricopeptide repeat-containing sensor histidine kinase [Marinoscillum furvescens]|nr:ATP-binding protein [Marinoscillum furvescens]
MHFKNSNNTILFQSASFRGTLFGCLLLLSCSLWGQSVKSNDLEVLLDSVSEETNIGDKLLLAKTIADRARSGNESYYLQKALLYQGGAYTQLGATEKALKCLVEGAQIAENLGLTSELGEFYGQISNVYTLVGDLSVSLSYQKKALHIFQSEEDVFSEGLASINIGYDYYTLGQLDSASFYSQKARELMSKVGFDRGVAYAIGNEALVLWKRGAYEQATNDLLQAIAILKEEEDAYAVSDYLIKLGELKFEIGAVQAAREKVEEALAISKAEGLHEQLRDGNLLLSKILEKQTLFEQAMYHAFLYMNYKDSIQNMEKLNELADLRTEYEVGQKQTEVDLLTAEKKTQQVVMLAIAVLALVLLVLGIIIYRFYREKSKINVELNRLIQTKDRFFSIISHDLRGPISSFQGVSRMIKFLAIGKQTDQLIELADDVSDSASKLSGLLDNLLTWALQQKGHFPYKPEPVACQGAVQEVLGTLKATAESKNITLAADVPAELQFWVDRNSTLTIIRNLVNNSIKFTPEGGKIEVKCMAKDAHIQMQVIDTGVGMPAEKLDGLFELKDKKSTYGTSGEKGLGLGLQLVHEFVMMNKGVIKVRSTEGVGTTFDMLFPRHQDAEVTEENKAVLDTIK